MFMHLVIFSLDYGPYVLTHRFCTFTITSVKSFKFNLYLWMSMAPNPTMGIVVKYIAFFFNTPNQWALIYAWGRTLQNIGNLTRIDSLELSPMANVSVAM
jgi:hypothetical protein